MPERTELRPSKESHAFNPGRRNLLTRALPAAAASIGWLSFLLGSEALITHALAQSLRPMLDAAADNPLADRVAAEARHILATVRHTGYQHHSHIDPTTGTYDCDCSEFVGFILEKLAPANYRLIPKEPNHIRPRAFKYCDYFRSLPDDAPGWHPIHKITSVRPGDVIAWRAPDIVRDEDTGHVMIAAAPAEPRGAGLFTVRVFDSSMLPHVNDTRGDNKSSYRSGVGEGGIVFHVDSSDRPIAFQFRPPDHFHDDPIAIGRIRTIV